MKNGGRWVALGPQNPRWAKHRSEARAGQEWPVRKSHRLLSLFLFGLRRMSRLVMCQFPHDGWDPTMSCILGQLWRTSADSAVHFG